jgi:hypothetical protein
MTSIGPDAVAGARPGLRLDSPAAIPTEVPRRLIGLVVGRPQPAGNAPATAEAQQAALPIIAVLEYNRV